MIKFLRALSKDNKLKYGNLYKQLLMLRQVLRWHGIYENILEINKVDFANISFTDISNINFMLFEICGDMFDRLLFIFDTIGPICGQEVYEMIDHLECDFYFFQCVTWLLFHIRTLKETFKSGTIKQKRSKILRITKYILDVCTSYCKFSKKVF